MKRMPITAVSALALMMSFPVYAGGVVQKEEKTAIGDEIKKGLRATDEVMLEAAEGIKGFFVSDSDEEKASPVVIRRNLTTSHLIGKDIVNEKSGRIATVRDIIIGKNGRAVFVVVSDGGILGIGSKVAAFDYNKVVTQRYDGDVNVALSPDMISRAAEFSYDQKDQATAKIIPTGSVSANQLIKGDVLDSKGDKVASIDALYFRNAEATQLVVSFSTTLGMGGHKAVLDYKDQQVVRDKGRDLHFQLTPNQTIQLKNFKSTAAN